MSSYGSMLEEDYRKKEEFVTDPPWDHISERRPDVESLEYRRVPKLDREAVVVRFADGTMLNVNVTGDSAEAIADDVLAALEAEG